MFETGRRSAISSSELGLYSDRADRYNTSKYGSVVKKFVIVVMAIVAIILAAIFIYDFASGASASSKVSQETKHIYILQNALKKPSNLAKKVVTTTPTSKFESEKLTTATIEDRSDNDAKTLAFVDPPKIPDEKARSLELDSLEPRAQSLENFKLRKKLLESAEKEDLGEEEVESKQTLSNHAVVYRVRQMYPHGESNDEEISEQSQPTPFHFKLTNPSPTSFKHLKFPQLTQYRYPHNSRNIQEIIKYLTNDPEASKRGIKFTGVYVNPKKYDFYPDTEVMDNTEKSELSMTGDDRDALESPSSHFSFANNDPFYPYKPKHPADVNLLASTNVRFSPSGHNRYNPYLENYMQRPLVIRPPPSMDPSYDNTVAYSGNYGKKRKAKPFSVMLDIYPITEINEQPTNAKVSRPRPVTSAEDFSPDSRRPFSYGRGGKFFASQTQPIPVVAVPANQPGISEDEEKQQMIFHLNLYPRKKNKLSRKDILQRSETMRPEDQEQFMKKVMSPFDAITKQLTDHSAIEESKMQDFESERTNLPMTKYEESFLEIPNEENKYEQNIPINHKENENDGTIEKTAETTKSIDQESKSSVSNIDFTSSQGFQTYADGLIATE